MQMESGEMWGRTPRNSNWPQVRAYDGVLPHNALGIEFYAYEKPAGEATRPYVS